MLSIRRPVSWWLKGVKPFMLQLLSLWFVFNKGRWDGGGVLLLSGLFAETLCWLWRDEASGLISLCGGLIREDWSIEDDWQGASGVDVHLCVVKPIFRLMFSTGNSSVWQKVQSGKSKLSSFLTEFLLKCLWQILSCRLLCPPSACVPHTRPGRLSKPVTWWMFDLLSLPSPQIPLLC